MKLGNLCEIVRGSSPRPKEDPRFYGGSIPRLMVADVTRDGKYVTPRIDSLTQEGAALSRPMQKGDLVIAVSGNPGLPAILQTDACIHDGFVGLRNLDRTRIFVDYLYCYLIFFKEQINNKAVGAIFKNLTTHQIADIEIPLPPLEEQRRIASILDKADAVRRKRKEAIALTEELLRSAFLEMFGDPVTNPKGWEIIRMAEVVSETQYGTADKANSEGEGIPILRMNNITYTGELDLDNLKWYSIAQKDEAKFTVRRGDLLFNRTNSPELVGKTAVWRSDEKYAFAGYLVRVRFKEEQALSEYVSAYLNSSYGKKYLFERAKPSINMSNFSASEFLKIPLLLPPIALQKHFVQVAEAARSSVKRLKGVVQDADNLFNSLLQRAFRGEL